MQLRVRVRREHEERGVNSRGHLPVLGWQRGHSGAFVVGSAGAVRFEVGAGASDAWPVGLRLQSVEHP